MDQSPEGIGATPPGSGPPPVVRAAIAGGLVLGLVVVVALAGFILRGGPDPEEDALDLQSVSTATILATTTVAEIEIIEEPIDPSTTVATADGTEGSETIVDPASDATSTTIAAPPRPAPATTTTVPPPPPPPPETLPPLPHGPYPTAVPVDRCTAASIADSLGIPAGDGGEAVPGTTVPETTVPGTTSVPESTVPGSTVPESTVPGSGEVVTGSEPRCVGPWAVLAVDDAACAADRRAADGRCTEVRIVRWAGERWIDRGLVDSACFDSVTQSGMSQVVNREVFGDNGDCNVRFSYRPEPSTGPLSIGDYGLRVAQLQIRLTEAGVFTDTIDGFFGRNTRAGVIDFQLFVDIDPDGVAGDATLVALGLPVR